MRKFEEEALPPASATRPGETLRLDGALAGARRTDELRSLVRFAIDRGYYDRWNSSPESGVRGCESGTFSTGR